MPHGSHNAVLAVARAYLETEDHSELVVPELREFEHVFTQFGRDLRLVFEVEVTSLRVTHIARAAATVQATRRLVPSPESRATETEEQELTLALVEDGGWQVADVTLDGRRFRTLIRDVTVEPPQAEGIA